MATASTRNPTWPGFHIIKYYRAIGMPIKEMQQFQHQQASGVPVTTARRQFMEDYRSKVVEQIAKLEETLHKVDYKIALFKQLEAAERHRISDRSYD
ncbi:MerR family transcriptional regulator [Paenibacillus lycopersici]|uniref:hypothetical protein n=1 Tax=Paenibacillus lycopersici TaxID=2704462 RepID=UPI001CDD4C8B|nr:hypothetical protein [Paenibacillus lycopersici]